MIAVPKNKLLTSLIVSNDGIDDKGNNTQKVKQYSQPDN